MVEPASLLYFDISWLIPLQSSFYYARQFHRLAGGGIRVLSIRAFRKSSLNQLSFQSVSLKSPSAEKSERKDVQPIKDESTQQLTTIKNNMTPERRAILNGLLRNWDFKRKSGEIAKQICHIIEADLCLLLLWMLH